MRTDPTERGVAPLGASAWIVPLVPQHMPAATISKAPVTAGFPSFFCACVFAASFSLSKASSLPTGAKIGGSRLQAGLPLLWTSVLISFYAVFE